MPSADLAVAPVVSEADRQAFLDLPHALYRADPNWVPPIRKSIARQLSADHPFRGYGTLQAFLARQGGQVVGRVVAAVNRRLIEKEGQAVGLFGYFECVDDPAVAGALFDAAEAWLRQQGCDRVRGPVNLSTHIDCLFLADGFDSPPCIMMPYNPRHYLDLVEAAGFRKAKDAYAYEVPISQDLAQTFERSHRLALAAGFSFRPLRMDKAGFEEDARAIYRVFTQSFADNWSSTPRSEDEFLEEARDLRQIAPAGINPMALRDGKVVGFWLALPDYNQALRHVGGRLDLWGMLKLLWYRREIDQGRVLAVAVLPEYQRARYALGPALVHLGVLASMKYRRSYHRVELSWVWEDNQSSRRLIEGAGGQIYKTYRVYEKALVD